MRSLVRALSPPLLPHLPSVAHLPSTGLVRDFSATCNRVVFSSVFSWRWSITICVGNPPCKRYVIMSIVSPLGSRVFPGSGNATSLQYPRDRFQQWRRIVLHRVATCAGATIFSNHVGRYWLRHRGNISAAHCTGASLSEL